MIGEVQLLLDQYWSWLSEKTKLRQVEKWVEITTPYFDRHNDYLQFYAKWAQEEFILTDDGYIIEDLEQSGCRIDSGRRRAVLDTMVNGFGVRINDRALEVRASREEVSLRKHDLVQAMLSVDDHFWIASPLVANLFHNDVEAWLDVSEI